MNWTVDALTLADARRIEMFWRARWASEGHSQEEIDTAAQFAARRLVDYDDDRRRGRWILLGAWYEDPRLVGYLSAVVVPRFDRLLGNVFIDELYVLPEHRRQGVGRTLLALLLDLSRRRGIANVQVTLGQQADQSWGLFERAGFEIGITGWGVCRVTRG